MEKSSFKTIYNSLQKNTLELKTLDSSFFNYAEFEELLKDNLKTILDYKDTYNNDYIQSIYENNELYSFYSEKIQTTTRKSEETIRDLKIKNTEEILDLVEDYKKNNNITIQKYKDQENDFKPKIDFLQSNKKINKEEYIETITSLNHERIKARAKYESIANDLVNKNEQVQFDFKHIEERFTDKNNQDIDKLQAKLKESNLKINEKFDKEIEALDEELKHADKIIADNNEKLNGKISDISLEFDRRKKFGFIPYDMEHNKVLDRIEDENKLFSSTEESILNEFKEKLQQTDNEIEKYRNQKKDLEEAFKLEINFETKTYHHKYKEQIYHFDRDIKALERKQNKDKFEEIKLKTLNKRRKDFVKKAPKEFRIKCDKLKADFLIKINELIDIIERLRSKKLRYEAVKSNAMKFLNRERDYKLTTNNNEIAIIGKKKEYFLAIEHCDENKRVLELRLPHDIELNTLNYAKSEYERLKHQTEYTRKYEFNNNRLMHAYQKDLLRINLDFQKSVLTSRVNHANVKSLLEIQKNKIIKDYKLNVLTLKQNHAGQKLKFYNECDKIQYDLYKLNRDLFNKKLDEEINLADKLYIIHKQGIKTLEEYEIRKLENINFLKTSKDRVALHQKRFAIEKSILNTTYLLFANSYNKIIEIENFLFQSALKLDLENFNKIRLTLINAFDYLRLLKLDLLDEYYDNEVKIINSRIAFEKDLKYNRILENLNKDKENALNQRNERKEKFIETINNYQNAINVFEKQILELEIKSYAEASKLKDLKKKNLSKKEKEKERLKIKKTISSIKENIQTIKVQISANERNIFELDHLLNTVNLNLKKVRNKFDLQIQEINDMQAKESKDYYKTISLITLQYSKIKDLINRNSFELNANRFFYKRLNVIVLRVNNHNGAIAVEFRDLFNNHFNKLCRAFERQIINLRGSFVKSYEKSRYEINQSRTNEINSNTAKVSAIYNEHNATITAMKRRYASEENRLFQNLKTLNENFNLLTEKNNQDIISLKEGLNNSLLCEEENIKTYDEDYEKETSDASKTYETSSRQAKSKLHKSLKLLEANKKRYDKMDKNRQISNDILKNNRDHEANTDFKTNFNNYTTRSKENLKEARMVTKRLYNLECSNIYNNFKEQQRKDHQEFKNQLIELEDRVKSRIKVQIKDYKKNLWH